MILVLQTTITGRISVWLVKDKKIIKKNSITVEWHGSDRALALVDKTLRQIKKDVHDITKIIVVRGPGSFTAVRTGLIIANTLGTLLKIPVAGVVTKNQLQDPDVIQLAKQKAFSVNIVKPWYGKRPNISRPKIKSRQASAKR